ncbi:MAG TPA: Crp/Fnr family transcriptional regulator [Firmicutes bacterium]|nr:Crp/Fnr family transcriptional regulator [Bacillota bacterium]
MKCHCEYDEESNCITLVPIFHSLTEEEMLEVAQITRRVVVQKGEEIYAMDDEVDSLFVIHSGRVKIYRLSDTGKEQVIRILRSGDFLGELTLFNHSPMGDYAEALEESSMCVIDGDALKELMGKYPSIAFRILEELSKRLETAERLLEDISLHSVERRLAQALLDLSMGDVEIELEMSKRDWASQIGMTGETLSRKLTSFQELGFIEQIGQRRILIKNRDGLKGVRERG